MTDFGFHILMIMIVNIMNDVIKTKGWKILLKLFFELCSKMTNEQLVIVARINMFLETISRHYQFYFLTIIKGSTF